MFDKYLRSLGSLVINENHTFKRFQHSFIGGGVGKPGWLDRLFGSARPGEFGLEIFN